MTFVADYDCVGAEKYPKDIPQDVYMEISTVISLVSLFLSFVQNCVLRNFAEEDSELCCLLPALLRERKFVQTVNVAFRVVKITETAEIKIK